MDPARKRTIRLITALSAAVVLASALVYTSFAAGAQEVTAGQLLHSARPGVSYVLAGTVMKGSVSHQGDTLLFRIRDPKLAESVLVRYTGLVPDPFAPGRGVMVTVHEQNGSFIGEQDSLTTKCPSKYQAEAAA